MKKNEKAVLIAKDVLERLEKGKLHLKRASGFIVINEKFPHQGSLQENLDKAEANCKVCALGGMFLSYARLFNGIDCEEITTQNYLYSMPTFSDMKKHLGKAFSKKALALIEGAFETGLLRRGYEVDTNWSKNEMDGIEQYSKKLIKETRGIKSRRKKAEHILTRICENIIENNGKFVVPKIA